MKTIDKIVLESDSFESFYGKVRDSFFDKNQRVIVVSDRVSSFDFVLGSIPYKGAVLNQIAAWWFAELDKLKIPHHLISTPAPQISVVKNAKPLPIEIIVRGYLTGTTKTSSWYAYQNHNRMISGIEMPEGMVKNQAFDQPIITPSTKPQNSYDHDENISHEAIIAQGLVSEEVLNKAEEYALKMFAHGQKIAAQKGLILVDTKYEMGIDSEGNLIIIDEVHTPDSSRYWLSETYEKTMEEGKEPESLSKEFVREKVIAAGYNVNSDENPAQYMTEEIASFASERYLGLYEVFLGKKFDVMAQKNEEELKTIIKESFKNVL